MNIESLINEAKLSDMSNKHAAAIMYNNRILTQGHNYVLCAKSNQRRK